MSKPVLEDLLTFSGRRNRQSFILAQLFQMAALFVAYLVLFAGLGLASAAGTLVSAVALAVVVGIFVSGWAVCSQRTRDIGYPGWACVLLLVPYLNVAVWVALAVAPSEAGDNKYGKNTVENA